MTTDCDEESASSEEVGRAAVARSQAWFRVIAVAIVLLSGLIYLPSLHGARVWDDTFLLKGTGLSGATTVGQCFTRAFLWNYYRPLTGATFVLDHRIWGNGTFGYHLTNLALHVLTTALLLPLLFTTFRSRRVALVGAMLFAIQPIQVSTVAWIGGRTDSLCTFFIALFLLILVVACKSTGTRRYLLLAASFVLYAAAAAAKEQALVLLPMVPLALYIFHPESAAVEGRANSGEQPDKRAFDTRLREMAVWTAPFLICGPSILLAWKKYGDPIHPHWNFAFQFPAVGQTIDYYVMLLLTPTPRLLHTWTLGTISQVGVISVIIGYLLLAVAIFAFMRCMRSEPVLAWFLAGTMLLLAPVSNMFPLVTQVVAPYRAGTAGLAAAAVIGWAIIKLWDRARALSPAGNQPVWLAAALTIYLASLGCLTFSDIRVWKTQMIASLAVEQYDPTSTFGTLEVAASYLDKGQTEPAITRLDRMMVTVRNHQYEVERSDSALWWMYGGYPRDWIAELYGRAGQIKLDKGDRQTAILLLNKGDALSPSNEIVRAGLANSAFAVHDLEGGIRELRTLLVYRPKLTDDRIVLAQVLWTMKRYGEADIELTKCIEKRPNIRNLYLMSAYSRLQTNNAAGARAVLNTGLQNGELKSDSLQAWLVSINQGGLMN